MTAFTHNHDYPVSEEVEQTIRQALAPILGSQRTEDVQIVPALITIKSLCWFQISCFRWWRPVSSSFAWLKYFCSSVCSGRFVSAATVVSATTSLAIMASRSGGLMSGFKG